MKGLTKTTLWEFLLIIQEKSKYNIQEIKKNNQKIKEYQQKKFVDTSLVNELITDLHQINVDIRKENIMLLNLHQNILKINDNKGWYSHDDLKKLKVDSPMPQEPPSDDECVKWLVDGKIAMSEEHPCLCKKDVLQRALIEMQKLERYEECNTINNLILNYESKDIEKSVWRQGILFKLLSFRLFKS